MVQCPKVSRRSANLRVKRAVRHVQCLIPQGKCPVPGVLGAIAQVKRALRAVPCLIIGKKWATAEVRRALPLVPCPTSCVPRPVPGHARPCAAFRVSFLDGHRESGQCVSGVSGSYRRFRLATFTPSSSFREPPSNGFVTAHSDTKAPARLRFRAVSAFSGRSYPRVLISMCAWSCLACALGESPPKTPQECAALWLDCAGCVANSRNSWTTRGAWPLRQAQHDRPHHTRRHPDRGESEARL
jgi:hypothetical protein